VSGPGGAAVPLQCGGREPGPGSPRVGAAQRLSHGASLAVSTPPGPAGTLADSDPGRSAAGKYCRAPALRVHRPRWHRMPLSGGLPGPSASCPSTRLTVEPPARASRAEPGRAAGLPGRPAPIAQDGRTGPGHHIGLESEGGPGGPGGCEHSVIVTGVKSPGPGPGPLATWQVRAQSCCLAAQQLGLCLRTGIMYERP
jgi:hypothetical protein